MLHVSLIIHILTSRNFICFSLSHMQIMYSLSLFDGPESSQEKVLWIPIGSETEKTEILKIPGPIYHSQFSVLIVLVELF